MGSSRGVQMPFGAYRGRSVASLDNAYLDWLQGRNLDEPLRTAVHEEAARRGIDRAGDWLRRQEAASQATEPGPLAPRRQRRLGWRRA